MRIARFIPHSVDPIHAIEWVIAVFVIIGAGIIFTPLYSVSVIQGGPTAVAVILSHPAPPIAWGVTAITGAILVIIGLIKDKPRIKSVGLFIIILARFFQILAIFLSGMIFPISSWLLPLTVTCIAVILWGAARIEVAKRAHT